jgi:hypothetical protein
MVCLSSATIRPSGFGFVGQEFSAGRLDVALAAGIAVNAAFDRPLRKYGRARLKLARFPFRIQLVLVGVILDQAPGRVAEVPELG